MPKWGRICDSLKSISIFEERVKMSGVKICLCSWPGGGTSVAAKELQIRLAENGLKSNVLSTGSIFRALAAAKYPELDPAAALAKFEVDAKTDLTIDSQVDGKIVDELRSGQNVIFDSRLAPYFAKLVGLDSSVPPKTCLVYLDCNPWVSALRVAARDNEVSIDKVSFLMLVQALAENQHRIVTAGSRYRMLYGISSLQTQVPAWDREFDTGYISTKDLVEVIMRDLTEKGWIG